MRRNYSIKKATGLSRHLQLVGPIASAAAVAASADHEILLCTRETSGRADSGRSFRLHSRPFNKSRTTWRPCVFSRTRPASKIRQSKRRKARFRFQSLGTRAESPAISRSSWRKMPCFPIKSRPSASRAGAWPVPWGWFKPSVEAGTDPTYRSDPNAAEV